MTEEEALAWIARLFEEEPGQVTAEMHREDIAAWDSLGVLRVVASLDSDFGIPISDDEVQGLTEVADILKILRSRGTLN